IWHGVRAGRAASGSHNFVLLLEGKGKGPRGAVAAPAASSKSSSPPRARRRIPAPGLLRPAGNSAGQAPGGDTSE
ncbi:hypothetical protein HGM15179_006404, partial [Zosterops borbonicus]